MQTGSIAKMDREKVINGLNDIGGFIAGRIGIAQARNFLRTIDDAIAMLKEQEAKAPCLKQDSAGIWCTCPNCGNVLKSALFEPFKEHGTFFRFPRYCEACGQAVKWE